MTTQQNQLIKNQKPIELDVHLKYRCPECSRDHWLALRESQTKGFIIVCECQTIIKPKLVQNIKVEYVKKVKPKPVTPVAESVIINVPVEESETVPQVLIPPENLVENCTSVLKPYGFTDSEAEELVHKTYQQYSNCTVSEFIRHCLKNITLGENNNG